MRLRGLLPGIVFVVSVMSVLAALTAAPALGYDVHDAIADGDCSWCHGSGTPTAPKTWIAGVHGGYTTTTDDCKACHAIHVADGSRKLLFADTVEDTCQTCHDSTGSGGVYGNIAARGLSVEASHSFDATRVIPGGDASTGGARTETFTGETYLMSCADCHSPHDSKTVTPFIGDRKRGMDAGDTTSTKLLRQRPTGAVTTVTVYGSDWCAACHRGRLSGGAVHNHPVDSLAVTATAFYYDNVARVATAGASTTTMGIMGHTNFGYVMPYPRTVQQSGHAPICQQCHEDPRGVGVPGAAVPYSVTWAYGEEPADNPRFQDFPHEATSTRFLIEQNDDLCMNCHPAATLP